MLDQAKNPYNTKRDAYENKYLFLDNSPPTLTDVDNPIDTELR